MRLLSNFLLFAAYVLIYSAVAAGGKFATEPWAALFADAYTTTDVSPQDAQTLNRSVSQATSLTSQAANSISRFGAPVRPRTVPNFTG